MAYEVIEGRYQVGSATFIDLITSQTALLQAESARAQALIDFMLQGKTVEFAIGGIEHNYAPLCEDPGVETGKRRTQSFAGTIGFTQ